MQLINALRKPSLTEKTIALAENYATRDGQCWYVFRRAPAKRHKLEMSPTHPGPGEYAYLRTVAPSRM